MTNYEKMKTLNSDGMARFLEKSFEKRESEYRIQSTKGWLDQECRMPSAVSNCENIKSMSLDEMAKELFNMLTPCKVCSNLDKDGRCNELVDMDMDCVDVMKDWLNSESEEE